MAIAVTTLPATNVQSISFVLHGSFTRDDENTTYIYFQYKIGVDGTVTTHSYERLNPPWYSGTYDGTYTNQDPGTIYYFRFGVKDLDTHITYWGSWLTFETERAVVVTTDSATEVRSDRATFNGHFTKNGERVKFMYYDQKLGLEGAVTTHTYRNDDWQGWNAQSFSNTYSGLIPDSVYYYRFRVGVYSILGGQWLFDVCGEWTMFKTAPLSSAVTKEATNLKNLQGTLNGETIVGEDGCVESGFEWKEGAGGVIHYEKILAYGGFAYSKVLTGLTNNTLYYFRARGKNDSRVYFYGEWLSFTTTSVIPSVSTQIATDLEALSVTGNGTIIDIGGGEPYCDKRGFEVTHSFSGTLKEYHAWKNHGFTGNIIFNSGTGLWEGTIVKSYEEIGEFLTVVFALSLDDLIPGKNYLYRAKAKNTVDWGYGDYLAFTTNDLLLRKACTCGIFTIMLCAYVKPIPLGSVIKRRGFRWGIYNTAQEYDIHEDGNFSASATIGPVDTISFVNSADDTVYDTIVDSAGGFLDAGFEAGKFINVSATGEINPINEGKFKIISVTADTITVNVRNTLVSESVTGVTIVDLFALYIVDLNPETDYYSVAYVVIEDGEGNWIFQEGDVVGTTTIVNIFDFESYDKVEFHKPEREQNYKKITRKINAEIISEQQYIDLAGGRRFLDIKNHLIQTKENAVIIGENYRDRFQEIKSLMGIEFPTPAPFQREDTLDIGFGRIRFKEDGKGVVNFMPDGEGLMLFRYRMVMLIRKINMDYAISKENIDYVATMELEEA